MPHAEGATEPSAMWSVWLPFTDGVTAGSVLSGTEFVLWNSSLPSDELLPLLTSSAGSEMPLAWVNLQDEVQVTLVMPTVAVSKTRPVVYVCLSRARQICHLRQDYNLLAALPASLSSRLTARVCRYRTDFCRPARHSMLKTNSRVPILQAGLASHSTSIPECELPRFLAVV